ncbi:MAG: hypothetical protein JXO49_00780 [Deltaproteobacteria bacterium]|nr:hypothetical protein [Candidatus Anaeroferrophillus wilburensis]MBN2887860.1 hypothetical protein [Deltaproteobacteria bacterium]
MEKRLAPRNKNKVASAGKMKMSIEQSTNKFPLHRQAAGITMTEINTRYAAMEPSCFLKANQHKQSGEHVHGQFLPKVYTLLPPFYLPANYSADRGPSNTLMAT